MKTSMLGSFWKQKTENDPYTAWKSGLDFDEFVASLYGESNSNNSGKSKTTAVTKINTKTKQPKTDFEGSFNFKVQLDEEKTRNSILNLHQKGYQLDEIVKAVFNLSVKMVGRIRNLETLLRNF
ncbi:MAG: hypothetical protein ACYTXI_38480 [Nostoc sp.]